MKVVLQKHLALLLLLALLLMAFSSCKMDSQQDKLEAFADWIKARGYDCVYLPLTDTGRAVSVPIFDESVWYSFQLGSEELFVYFDTSNRAKQLAEQFCSDPAYGRTVAFRLRFIVNYRGTDEAVLKLLDGMEAA